MDYHIYYVRYGTTWRTNCDAVIAEESKQNLISLLEKHVRSDSEAKKQIAKLRIWNIRDTGFITNKKGLI